MLYTRDESAVCKPSSPASADPADVARRTLWLSDDEFQSQMLDGVSRTFALTIPQLPLPLCRVVANAYLLCRIVDTIEDEPALTGVQKSYFCQQFLKSFNSEREAEFFSRQFSALLSSETLPVEHVLVRNIPRVIRIHRSFSEPQREAVQRCVRTMARGMGEFQLRNYRYGLETLEDLDRYCYYVAGIVGKMLTRLFCFHSSEIAKHGDALMRLAGSFGQGLQMTNILKDVWEDYRHGACWLPREVFAAHGFELSDLMAPRNRRGFELGVKQLVAIAHAHLRNALSYSLLMPKAELGIRAFCLWAIGLAVLTLRKIYHHLDYTNGSQVKISRLSVTMTLASTRLALQNDRLLKLLFYSAGLRLPLASNVISWSPGPSCQDKVEMSR